MLLASFLARCFKSVVRPEARLPLNFPWNLKTTGKVYAWALLAFIDGTLLPVITFIGLLLWLEHANWDLFATIVRFTFTADHNPTPLFTMALSSLTFLTGFGAELAYIEYRMRQQGLSLRSTMALNFDAVPGKRWYQKGWQILWRIVVVYLLWMVIERLLLMILPAPEQGTVDFARSLTGQPLLALTMFLMAAVGAPIFEEIVFRGFLFNALRTSLRSGRVWSLLGKSGTAVDVMAIVVSSLVFALYHLQFQPTTLIMLFLLGCLHAELYRRTGSLPVSMALHCLNNSIAMLLVFTGH